MIKCILAIEESLDFLKEITDVLKEFFREKVEVVNLEKTTESYAEALEIIKDFCSSSDLLIFLAHGGPSKIAGHEGETLISAEAAGNVEILKDKKIIAVSCSTKDGFAQNAIDSGALVYIGFGDIPFDSETNTSGVMIKDFVTKKSEKIFSNVLIESLKDCIEKNLSFYSFISHFKYQIDSACDNIFCEPDFNDKKGDYLKVLAFLQDQKNGIKLFGNGDLKLDN